MLPIAGPAHETTGVWHMEKRQSLDLSRTSSVQPPARYEELPFFGPPDPPRWPLHKTFFLGGLLFPPFWFVGGWLPVRDGDDTCETI